MNHDNDHMSGGDWIRYGIVALCGLSYWTMFAMAIVGLIAFAIVCLDLLSRMTFED